MRLLVGLSAAFAVALVSLAPLHGQRAASPTFADVSPIFKSKCTGCHMQGGIAPFSLTSAKQARIHAALIKVMTQAALMPPWPPGRDSLPFVGQSGRQLTALEKDLIARWAAGGARVGGHVAPPPRAAAVKGAVFAPRAAYTPHAAVGLDDYHCTLLDPKLAQRRM